MANGMVFWVKPVPESPPSSNPSPNATSKSLPTSTSTSSVERNRQIHSPQPHNRSLPTCQKHHLPSLRSQTRKILSTLRDQLPYDKSPVKYFQSLFAEKYPEKDVQAWRAQSGRFGLSGAHQTSVIRQLSNGLRNRVVFAQLAMEHPHILLLAISFSFSSVGAFGGLPFTSLLACTLLRV
ncbi:hypothetical protein D9758_017925 [Tetrapyrgos nigripes]|uniref:Uncharacterized protein n=1 Tax=Tetrapyrgos nigripes TaxID=182062 RepID=A0A8H5C2K2_9AGAR|nr:hypothetical protein D9758_017925 [Tetrapyrgos nigripes]